MSYEKIKISEEQAGKMICKACTIIDDDEEDCYCDEPSCCRYDEIMEQWKKEGFIQQSAVERYEEMKKAHEGFHKLEIVCLADAAIKELQEKIK